MKRHLAIRALAYFITVALAVGVFLTVDALAVEVTPVRAFWAGGLLVMLNQVVASVALYWWGTR